MHDADALDVTCPECKSTPWIRCFVEFVMANGWGRGFFVNKPHAARIRAAEALEARYDQAIYSPGYYGIRLDGSAEGYG